MIAATMNCWQGLARNGVSETLRTACDSGRLLANPALWSATFVAGLKGESSNSLPDSRVVAFVI